MLTKLDVETKSFNSMPNALQSTQRDRLVRYIVLSTDSYF